VWPDLALGPLAVLVATQLSVLGSYLPPVLREAQTGLQEAPIPPQTIISLPVQIAV
jgi:hypothetical protein